MRVGLGYDVHRLVEGRDLILGGVKIPYVKGLLGHSDADVLLHAVMDACTALIPVVGKVCLRELDRGVEAANPFFDFHIFARLRYY